MDGSYYIGVTVIWVTYPRVLGTPVPKSLAIWVSPCFCYPPVPSRDSQNPSDLGIPSQMRVEFPECL